MNKEAIDWMVKRCIASDDESQEESGESAKKKKRIEVITIDDSPAPKIKSSARTPICSPNQTQKTETEILAKEKQTDLKVSQKPDSVASKTKDPISPHTQVSAAGSSVKKLTPKISPNHSKKNVPKENQRNRFNLSKAREEPNHGKARSRSTAVAIDRARHSRNALNFECISNPNNKKPVNSAGERFDAEHYLRNLYRTQLLRALQSGHVPQGASNPIATAQSIEAFIFKKYKCCNRDYKNHVTERSGFLNSSEYRELRLNVVMGRIKPEQYAFMSIDDMEHEKMVELRIATKLIGRCTSIRDL